MAKTAKTKTVTLTLPDGTRKYYRGRTKKEAEAKRRADEQVMGHNKGTPSGRTFGEFAEQWFRTNYSDNQSVHIRTVETARGTLDRYVLPYLKDKVLTEISPMDIRGLMNSVSDKSQSTQRKVLQVARSILESAAENDLIAKNPAVKSIKAKRTPPAEETPLTDEQLNTLLEAVKGTRVYLFVEVLAYAGLRKGEALGLMWSDINFKTGELHVQSSIVYPINNRRGEINPDMKTSHAERFIPLPETLLKDLAEAKKNSTSPYVFTMKNGSYLSEPSFVSMWKLIGYRTIGKEGSREVLRRTIDFDVHPHHLRHTCITYWMRKGLNVKELQYLAGHSTPDITMKIYAHYQLELERKNTAEKIRGVCSS